MSVRECHHSLTSQVREWWKMTENAANIQTLKVTLKNSRKPISLEAMRGTQAFCTVLFKKM